MISAAFFTEAGSKKGMGHLTRCYTIFTECKRQGMSCDFFLDSDIDYNYKFEDIKYFNWGALSLQKQYDVIVIDSYIIDLKIYKDIMQYAKCPVYIDDNARVEYPKGMIINFAPDAEKLFFKHKDTKHTYLLGLDYIPIRKEFLTVKPQKKQQLFIMLGGSDIANLSLDILRSIEDVNIEKVIVINEEKSLQKLKSLNNIKILFKPSNRKLINEMANSIAAISTASMTLYELNYFKIPTIIVALNHNQYIGAPQLIKHKLAAFSIDVQNPSWKNNIKESLTQMLKSQAGNINLLVDGNGAKRIVKKIKQLVK